MPPCLFIWLIGWLVGCIYVWLYHVCMFDMHMHISMYVCLVVSCMYVCYAHAYKCVVNICITHTNNIDIVHH